MRAQLHYGFTPKFWGLELSVDFYWSPCLAVRIGPFWVALEAWAQ
jgi:hypothetical protein